MLSTTRYPFSRFSWRASWLNHQPEMPHQRLVLRPQRLDVCNRLLRNEQQVGGGLRVDVLEHDAVFVFQYDVRRDLAIDDPLKDRLVTHTVSASFGHLSG